MAKIIVGGDLWEDEQGERRKVLLVTAVGGVVTQEEASGDIFHWSSDEQCDSAFFKLIPEPEVLSTTHAQGFSIEATLRREVYGFDKEGAERIIRAVKWMESHQDVATCPEQEQEEQDNGKEE